MPGIVGRIGGNPGTLAGEIDAMVQSMLHESFYESATFVNERESVGLGSIVHPKSFAAGQRYCDAARDTCLVFSGECVGLSELVSCGGHSEPNSNAGQLLALYERYGQSFVEKLNGSFSGALCDFRTGKTLLFNDRYGLSRIYHCQQDNAFYFASEAKAILAVRPELREVDTAGLAEVFSCGCTLSDKTLFKRLALVPPASLWTISRDGRVQHSRYFDPKAWESQETLDEEGYYQDLKDTFARTLPRYFGDSESLGMSLTGGLDGRMIMAYAPPTAGRFPCYTFGGRYRDCADVSIARQVAKSCGQTHQVLPIGDDFLRQFPEFAEKCVYLSDGTMEVAGAVEIYANRLARKVAPIRLTGNYGSEILRRNVAFRPRQETPSFLDGDFAELVGLARATYEEERACETLSFVAFKQVPWHHHARLSIEQSQLTVRSPYLDNDLVGLAYRAPKSLEKSALPALRLVAERDPSLGRIPTDRGLLYQPRPVANTLLRTWREGTVRAEYVYDYGMPSWVARVDNTLRWLHLERLFLGRHKFYHFRVWYRDQLAPFVRDLLLSRRSLARPYIRRVVVEKLVDEHLKGRRNHTVAIHKLLTAELFHRRFIDDLPPVSKPFHCESSRHASSVLA